MHDFTPYLFIYANLYKYGDAHLKSCPCDTFVYVVYVVYPMFYRLLVGFHIPTTTTTFFVYLYVSIVHIDQVVVYELFIVVVVVYC